jgi:hypothetical protein
MKAAGYSIGLLAVFALTGCSMVVSRNSLYSSEIAVTDIDLSGVWLRYDKTVPADTRRPILVTKKQDGSFSMCEVGDSRTINFQLVRLGANLFLDISVPSDYADHRLLHLIELVKIKDNCVGICQCDPQKLRQELQLYAIPNTSDSFGQYLTAQTSDLQRLFAASGENLFSFDADHQTLCRQDGRDVLKSNESK